MNRAARVIVVVLISAQYRLMVERGHLDRVGRDRWVAHEFAKVRWLYAQLGLANHADIEFLQGGHSINGVGTFAFLQYVGCVRRIAIVDE